MSNTMWARDPEWPSDRPWERVGAYWQDEFPEHWERVSQGARAIDVLGREVFVGDRIAVAVTVSRSANMRVGTVIDIEEIQEEDWESYRETNYTGKIPKKGSGKFRIKCEWEASGWQQNVKASAVEAGLPKYIKL